MEDRKPEEMGYSGKDSTECKEYLRVSSLPSGSETNNINGYVVKERVLEKICSKHNFRLAFNRVRKNKGAAGIDGMQVEEARNYLNENWNQLQQSILEGKYHPQPVRRVEIPKDNGKKRNLGIPTVIDRIVQQAIAQVLTPVYEPIFSDNSFGFRPNRSAHDALRRCQENMNNGYKCVVDMDMAKFFDKVNHDLLITILSRNIKDGRVISLIHKYLKAGVMISGEYQSTIIGVPQGGPLSPLLANAMLNELDKELEERGHKFVRYADDVMIFTKSKRSAERVMKSITQFIEKKLKLEVNKEKTTAKYCNRVKYLGYGFYNSRKGIRFRVHPKSVSKLKDKLRLHLSRSRLHVSNEQLRINLRRLIIGWINYFKLADMKYILKGIDEWMRRKIRCRYWKQWKKVKTRYRYLRKLGLNHNDSFMYACTRKGYWRISGSPIMSIALNNDMLRAIGFLFFSDYYKTVKY